MDNMPGPGEYSTQDQLARGAQVLLDAVLSLAEPTR